MQYNIKDSKIQDVKTLVNALNRGNNRNYTSSFYPFYLLPEGGQARIRFLPDPDPENPQGFLTEKKFHFTRVNGQLRQTPCLDEMFGIDCPFCREAKKFFKEEGDGSKAGKTLWKKTEWIGWVLVVKDQTPINEETGKNYEGRVMPIQMRWQLYNALKNGIENSELDALPYSYEGGYDFLINKTLGPDRKNASYTSSMFARKPTDLSEEEIERIEEELKPLSTLLPKNPGVEETESLLQQTLVHILSEDDGEPVQSKVVLSNTPSPQTETRSESTTTSKPVDTTVDDDEEDEDEDLLQQIRNRRNRES